MNLFQRLKFEWHRRKLLKMQAARRARIEREERFVQPRSNMIFGSRQQGWTLLELMVVCLIIGIASALAIPAYASFTVRAAASESIQQADGVEKTVTEAFQANGLLPNSEASAGMTGNVIGKYSNIALYDNGTIVATFTANAPAAIAGQTVQFKPYLTADGVSLAFVCGYATPLAGWIVPANDGTTGGGASPGTTVSPAYLPRNCRVGG